MALVDWHVTPEYINENWTEEELYLMFVSRRKRIERQVQVHQEKPRYISNEEFFTKHNIKVHEA